MEDALQERQILGPKTKTIKHESIIDYIID
jgi:hypothetical protein